MCSEGFYKSVKGHAQCQKCGKNSFNDPSTRFECRCGNVESGPTFRVKEEEEKKNWSADCFGECFHLGNNFHNLFTIAILKEAFLNRNDV